MAFAPFSARRPGRAAFAWFRLLGCYILLCYALLELGLAGRELMEALPFSAFPLPTPTADAYPSRLPGINVALQQYPDSAARRAALADLARTGFGWVRQRVDWGALEPAPGYFDWAEMDAILSDVAAAGLEAVVVLDGSPAWARLPRDRAPTDNPTAPPADFADFARFAEAFAHRYRQQARFYQIWDEPNIAPHWGNQWIEPVEYSRLLAQAASAIRAADPDAVILLAALAPTADRGHTAIDEAYYLRRLYAAGAAPFFDASAAEPFGFGLAPNDTRSRTDVLNFQRVGLLRRVMLAAGDGAKPVWAVRYGWNQAINATWQTVSPETQARYVAQAISLARGWPWLAGLGWAVDQPLAPPQDPLWGFALHTSKGQPAPLLATFGDVNASHTHPSLPTLRPLVIRLLLWWVVLVWAVWRGWAAGRIAGVGQWPARFAAQSQPVKVFVWLLLIALYYFATWPPLIGLCWLVGALLLGAQPLTGLLLAAFLLPFHFQHKEVALIGTILAVPPAQAALLCTLPGVVPGWLAGIRRPRGRLLSADWLALGWLSISLLSAVAAWDWMSTPGGLWGVVFVPLLLYGLARTVATSPRHQIKVGAALAAGGVAAAGVGLCLWWGGDGVSVDGVRRLIGLTFSPNQTALMLERGLFVSLGLMLARWGERGWHWLWMVGLGFLGLALLLTGSRGALLLGIPAGVAFCLVCQPAFYRRLRLRPWLVAVLLAAGLLAGGLLLGERLLNSDTVAQRLHIWQGALDLWRAYPWLGVGPGGFFWHYPAFMTAAAASEPNLLHPHLLWLEFATGWGVAGLLWVLAFGYWLVSRVTDRRTQLGGLEMGLLAGLVAGIAHGQVDAFGALPELAAWNWLVIALLSTQVRQNRKIADKSIQ